MYAQQREVSLAICAACFGTLGAEARFGDLRAHLGRLRGAHLTLIIHGIEALMALWLCGPMLPWTASSQ